MFNVNSKRNHLFNIILFDIVVKELFKTYYFLLRKNSVYSLMILSKMDSNGHCICFWLVSQVTIIFVTKQYKRIDFSSPNWKIKLASAVQHQDLGRAASALESKHESD